MRTNRNFYLPVEQFATIGTDHGQVVSTKHEILIFTSDRTNATDLLPCMYQEADRRLLLHAADAARRG